MSKIKSRFRRIYFCTTLLAVSVSAQSQQSVGEWGVMLHDDGDSLFTPQKNNYCSFSNVDNENPLNQHMRYIQCRYRYFHQAGIDTLKLNVFSSLAYFDFDQKIAPTISRLDSRADLLDRTLYPAFAIRVDLAKQLFALGPNFDPVYVALNEFKNQGGKTVLSFRISDSHYLQVAKNSTTDRHPLVSEFFLNNPSWIIGQENLSGSDDYRLGKLMDFARQDVRKHFISIVYAGVAKYKELIDAVEVDFTRNPVLFKSQQAQENKYLIENMLSEIRRLMREAGRGDLKIIVRVPLDRVYAHSHGIDIDSWVEKKLVDVIVPSELMSVDPDPDIKSLISIAKDSKVLVYYGMPARRNPVLWRFVLNESKASDALAETKVNGNCDQACVRRKLITYRLPSPDFLIGAAVNAKFKGADGVELYNLASESIRSSQWFSEVLLPGLKNDIPPSRAIFSASHNTSNRKDRSPESIRSQLPKYLDKGKSNSFRIFMGSSLLLKDTVWLRLGLLDMRNENCEIEMHENGRKLNKVATFESHTTNNAIKVSKKKFHASALDAPDHYFPEETMIFSIQANQVNHGYNEFSLECTDDNVLLEAELLSPYDIFFSDKDNHIQKFTP